MTTAATMAHMFLPRSFLRSRSSLYISMARSATGLGSSIWAAVCLMKSMALFMVRSEEEVVARRLHLLKPESPFGSARRVDTPKSENSGLMGPPTRFGFALPVRSSAAKLRHSEASSMMRSCWMSPHSAHTTCPSEWSVTKRWPSSPRSGQ